MLNYALPEGNHSWQAMGHLIALLHNASREQESWSEFMQEFISSFQLNSCHLVVVNDLTNAVLVRLSAGTPVAENYLNSYQTKYISQDLIMNQARTSDSREFFVTNHWEKKEYYYNSPYYKQWALPQGLSEGGAACIFAENDWRCIMVHNRTQMQGDYSHNDVQSMNYLLPYIEQAIKSCYMADQFNQHNARTQTIIEGYRTPVAILTEFGKIWGKNQLMEDMLANENKLYIRDGVLRAGNADTDRQMTRAIMNTANTSNSGKPCFVDINQDIRLHFKAINEKQNNLKTNKGVLLFALSRNYRKHVSEETLMGMFSLTPAEASVCKHILEGQELKEIASIRSKSVNTIREQLYQSFKKTGCNSQTSLINMLTSIPMIES